MINQTMAARYWPDGDAVGKRFKTGGLADTPWWTVVGVVGDMRQMGLDVAPEAELYLPANQLGAQRGVLLAPALDRSHCHRAVRARRRRARCDLAIDPDQPVSTCARWTKFSTRSSRTATTSYARRRVCGARAVLGGGGPLRRAVLPVRAAHGRDRFADRARREARHRRARCPCAARSLLACVGLAVGAAGALALTRVVESFLFGVSATDPITFAAAAALLLLVTGAAAYLPARRAANVDPMTALRNE